MPKNTSLTAPLKERCSGTCELCNAEPATIAYAVSPKNNDAIENEVAICTTCLAEMDNKDAGHHWQCLAGSIWNTEASVQALSYRILFSNKEQE